MSNAKRYTNFTVSDYTLDLQFWQGLLDKETISYFAWGAEVCPTTGRDHWQGYFRVNNAQSESAARKTFKPRHIEVMIGSILQNETYCSKESKLNSIGIKPISNDNKGRAEQLRWQTYWEYAKQGRIEEIDAMPRTKHYNTFKRIGMDYLSAPAALQDVCGVWIYGPTGAGKSHIVREQYPVHFLKSDDSWWIGYQGEDVVYLEDLGKDSYTLANHLKRWGDKYPFAASVKFGGGMYRPRKFIVTSQYRPCDLAFNSEDLMAIERRFTLFHKPNKNKHFLFYASISMLLSPSFSIT